jgi:choline-sulfatase
MSWYERQSNSVKLERLMKPLPNIVLVMSDQHRADMMGCAGDPVVKTPNLDRLAAEGSNFTRAYCQGPLCMPARSSLLSERYVRDHGVFVNSSQVPPEMPTFVQRLREAGYHTCEIGKMHLYPHRPPERRNVSAMREVLVSYGFDEPIETVGKLANRAFDTTYTEYLRDKGLFEEYRAFLRRAGHIGGKNGVAAWQSEPCPLSLEDYADAWLGRRATQWIDGNDGAQPFFLWVGFPGPHDPWDAPLEALELYRDAEIPLPRYLTGPVIPPAGPLKKFLEKILKNGGSATMTDAAIIELRRAYYANISVIDNALGRIVEALRRKAMLDYTWIVYTSDHGEMMGEHRMLGKKVFYEPSVRVPMIIRPPGGTQPRTINERVQLMDLGATFRAVASAAPIEHSAANSLLPSLTEGHAPASPAALPSENYGFAMFLTERYKLMVDEDTCEPLQLFDLWEDPAEDRNLCYEPSGVAPLNRLMEEHARPFLATPPLRPPPDRTKRATRPPAP